MALKNLKVEAMRLEEAKRAIKKLKQKRREGKRVEAAIPTVSNPIQEDFNGCAKGGLKLTDTAQESSKYGSKVLSRKKPLKLCNSVSVRTSANQEVVPGLFCDFLSPTKELEHDTAVTPNWESPALIPMSVVTKTYSNKVRNSNEEEGTLNLDVPSFKIPMKGKAIKKKKTLKLRKKIVNQLKKPHAPMYVTMSSVNTRGPVFSTSQDGGICNESESETESMLNTQVTGVKRLEKCSKGSFCVTTVSDSTLPMSDGSGMDEECSEVDGGDLPDTESYDELPDNEVAPKVYNQLKNDPSTAQFHFLDGNVILHLKHPASFVFCGQLQVEVLKGTVEILGYQLTSSGGPQIIFSPRGFSLLSMQTVLSDGTYGTSNLDSSLMTSLLEDGNAGDAFILMRKAEYPLPLFLEQYVPTKLFPQLSDADAEDQYWKAGKKLQCICNPTPGCKLFQKGDLWDEVSDHVIQQQPGCTVLCGGKGVGKSTMLRFLVNRLLSSGKEEVLLIDFDPGQNEVTVPGCLSLSIIRKPLLGPNFTHLQNPEKCVYIGDINISNCVSRYMDACVSLVNYWQSKDEFKTMPCLVNTMGFNKGLGITLMVQIISILQPTSVIQILSKSNKRNYPELMSVDYVKRNCSNSPFRLKLDIQMLTQGRRLSCASSINYDLHVVNSASESQTDQYHQVLGIEAKSSREIVTLSYLSQIVSAPRFSLLDTVPYCCPLDGLYLSVCHESVPPSIILSVFNASLVALCCVNPKEGTVVQSSVTGLPSIITKLPTADCLGFGIVRGIDMESKQLYLLTPLSPSALIAVNCLVAGAVSLPACVLLTPPKEPGPVPYVIVGESQRTAKPLKRSFRFSRYAARP